MQLYYALYDPATPQDGTYWTWFAGILQKETLHNFYNDIAVKQLPPEPNKLEPSDIWGGIVRYRNWTVLYRYYNGGYDSKGRPGRYVILTAWIPTDETAQIDLAPIFDNNTFKGIAENSQKLPVPEPLSLLEHWTGEEKTINVQLPEKESVNSYQNIVEAAITFTNIPLDRNAWVKMTKQGIMLTIGAKPGPTKEEMLQQKLDSLTLDYNNLTQDYHKLSAEKTELYNTLRKLHEELQNKEKEIVQLNQKLDKKNDTQNPNPPEVNNAAKKDFYNIRNFIKTIKTPFKMTPEPQKLFDRVEDDNAENAEAKQ
ncbi:MAG: hypothetical protein LBE12_18155 [Planctomycetaceae bacterium]|jgi:hypothetical protein|nr:hypothetical protein [Planctomycetaceae bacterium]